jgi:hypothetical protein
MDDTKCPLCGEPMEPSTLTTTVSCHSCNKSWTPRHLAIAAGFRAQTIAEAVKPLEDMLIRVRDGVILELLNGDFYDDLCALLESKTNRP